MNTLHNKIALYASVLIGIMFASGSCKKEDYREKWVGAYDCEVNVSRWSMDSTGGGSTQEYQYQTIVEVSIANDSMMLFLLNKENEVSREVRVYKDGSFYEVYYGGERIEGIFYADSLELTFSSISPGATSISHYKGKKQK